MFLFEGTRPRGSTDTCTCAVSRGLTPPPLRITRVGLQAIGVETEDDASESATPADTGATSADAGTQGTHAAAPAAEAGTQGTHAAAPAAEAGAAVPTPSKARARATKPGKAAPADKPKPRAGTKQAQMIEMLERPEGARVEQIAAAAGWQHHTIRGALKKELGLTVEATRTREVGPEKTGAKGSSTVHRITGSGPAAD